MSDNTDDNPNVPQERTILILGETGVGKSSLVNNISLVLQFPKLDDDLSTAVKAFTPLIATRGSYKEMDVTYESDSNEREELETFRTIKPRMYKISSKSCVFNLLDTPGIKEFDGEGMDMQYLDHVTDCIEQYNQIHAILVVVTASNNTLTSRLKNLLDELLNSREKTAAKHIHFIVTHVGKNMNTKNAFSVINAYIRRRKDIQGIEMNLYGFEAEPLHYVMGLKKGNVPRKTAEYDDIHTIFRSNRAELLRLFKRIYNCSEPYDVKNIRAFILVKNVQSQVYQLVKSSKAKIEESFELIHELQLDLKNRQLELSELKRKWIKHNMFKNEEIMDHALEKVVRWTLGGVIAGAALVLVPETDLFVAFRSLHPFAAKVLPESFVHEAGVFGAIGVLVGVLNGAAHYFWRINDEIDLKMKKNVEGIRSRIRELETVLENELRDQKFLLEEKNKLHNLYEDINAILEKNAIVTTSSVSSDVVQSLEMPILSGHGDNETLSIDHIFKRLEQMTSHTYFGKEVARICSKWKNAERIKINEVNINLTLNNDFIRKMMMNPTM